MDAAPSPTAVFENKPTFQDHVNAVIERYLTWCLEHPVEQPVVISEQVPA
jgi:hypothetical protein